MSDTTTEETDSTTSALNANSITIAAVARKATRIALSELLEEIEVPSDDIFEILVDSMSCNVAANEVVINQRDFIEDLTTEQLSRLFAAVGKLPNLSRLSIQFLLQPGEPVAIPIAALTEALSLSAHSLAYLEVAWVHLEGNNADFVELLHILKSKCRSLVEVKFRNLCFTPNDGDYLETLLAAFSKLPKIRELFLLDANRIINEWNMRDQGGQLALESLCRSLSLKTLCLMVPLSEAQVSSIAVILANNNTLEHLALFRCNVSNQGCTALAGMLRQNTKLQILRLDDNQIGNPGCIGLAQALHTNRTLRILDLKGNNKICRIGYTALCKMLEFENYAIMGLDSDASDELGARIGFFIELNEQARNVFLFHCNNRALFVGCLHTFGDQLDILYYYLKANPAMCQM